MPLQLGRLSLHACVWDDATERLEMLLSMPAVVCHLEEKDARGNTALQLALRMGRTRCTRMLLAAGAFPKPRTDAGWEAVHLAALTCNADLVRTAVLAMLRETDAAFSRRLPGLQAALAKLPDFSLKIVWTFSSWVPLVSGLLPSDTWWISKRGSSLRLDSTLLGMSGMRWERGSLSLLLWGADMPRPGALFVLDNERKTMCDARLAFTHPQDSQVQDWVRKLLTATSKTTDVWSRDVVCAPVLRRSMLGSLGSGLARLAGGGGPSRPRGRVSEVSIPLPPASPPDSPRSPPPSPVDRPPSDQLREDVGVWQDCRVYEMANLCVRDLTLPPLLPELKLADWWRPEYSREATAADLEARSAAHAAGAVSSDSTAGGVVDEEDAPERKLGLLKRALAAIRSGKINEKNAASATVAELEGMGFADAPARVRGGGAHAETLPVQAIFGDEVSDSAPQNATGVVCDFDPEALRTENKVLDVRVCFSTDFPLTAEQFLPVAEIMARTGRHAENFRAFFTHRLPRGVGFPVKFEIPAFPTIKATICFDQMEVRRSPPKAVFELPTDFTNGAYVERGWIRQL